MGTVNKTTADINNILNLANGYVAAPFNSATSYKVGDYCSRSGKVYRCKTAGAAAWNASRWTEVVLGDEVANRGVYGGIVTTGGVSVPNDTSNTFTQIQSMSLSAGLWLVMAGTSFTNNSSGWRQIGLTATNSISVDRTSPLEAAATGTGNSMQIVRVFDLTSSGTVYVWARQNSGSSLTCYPYIQAVRLR